MKKYLIILVAFLSVITNVISQTYSIPWTNLPYQSNWVGLAGVPGGVDQYSTNYTMFCNVLSSIPGTTNIAYGDGIHDDTAALQYAIYNCPNNEFVYIPAGHYKMTSGIYRMGVNNYDGINHPFSIIVRGDGMGKTILENYSTTDPTISFNNAGGFSDTDIITTNSRGTTNFSSASFNGSLGNLGVGQWIVIQHADSLANVYTPPEGDPEPFYYYYGDNSSQLVKLLSITNGNTVTFWPPLNEGYGTNDYWSAAASPPFRTGIENLSVYQLYQTSQANISFGGASECWIRNVESCQARTQHIVMGQCGGCEISGCFVHNPIPFPDGNNAGGSSDYGIDLTSHSSECLIINNIALHCRHSFILEQAAGQNNVIAYNYGRDNINEGLFETDYQEDTDYHGGEPRYNLWEGNTVPIIRADTVEGVTKYDIFLRNHVTRDGIPNVTVAINALDIQRGNWYDYFIDNVYDYIPTNAYYQVYRIGSWEDDQYFPNTTNIWDPQAITNDTWINNLDFADNSFDYSTNGVIYWSNSPVSITIPQSLLYSNKPDWYSNGLTWPPFGSDVAGYTNLIPAQLRAATVTGFFNRNISDSYSLILSNTTGGSSTWLIGSGSNYYNSGLVSIRATAQSNYVFTGWSGTGATNVAKTNTALTYFLVPSNNINLTANFTLATNYTLTVSNGSGGGSYQQFTLVNIAGDQAPTNYQFAYWIDPLGLIVNTNSLNTSITMPATNVTVQAVYVPITFYSLIVTNGTITGYSGYSSNNTANYSAGTVISIQAANPPAGLLFYQWNGYTFANSQLTSTTLIMPSNNLVVGASYSASQIYPVTNGLIAWWSYETNTISGSTENDSSTNGNNLTLIGSPTSIPGQIGQALQFNGSSQYGINTAVTFDFSADNCVTTWVKEYTGGYFFTAGGQYYIYSINGINLQANGTDMVVEWFFGSNEGNHTFSNVFNTNQWNFIAVNFSSNSVLTIYVNNVLVGTTGVVYTDDPDGAVVGGGWWAGNIQRNFNGDMDDTRIYNRQLTTNEIQDVYTYSLPIIVTNYIYLPFFH